MSIHETIPQQPYEPEQQPPFSAQETIKNYSDAVFDGNVPTYDGYRAAYQLSNEIYQEGDVYYHESGEKLDAGTAEEFIHCASPDRWALKADEHAKYFRVSRATSIDSLKSTDRRNAEFRLQDPSATDEMILREAKADANKRITLSSQIYEQYGKDQPMTSRTERVMANEALGITPETRKAEEIANAKKKAQRSFVAQHAPAVVKFMRTKDRKAAVEDTDFPIGPDELAKVGISRYEVLEDMALSFMLEKIEQATNRAEKVAAPNTPWGEQTAKKPNAQESSTEEQPAYNAANIPVPPSKRKATSVKTPYDAASIPVPPSKRDATTRVVKPIRPVVDTTSQAPDQLDVLDDAVDIDDEPTATETSFSSRIRERMAKARNKLETKTFNKLYGNPTAEKHAEAAERRERRIKAAKTAGKVAMKAVDVAARQTKKAAEFTKEQVSRAYDKVGEKAFQQMFIKEADPEVRSRRILAAKLTGKVVVGAAVLYGTYKLGEMFLEHGQNVADIPAPEVPPTTPPTTSTGEIYGSNMMPDR